MKNSRLMRTVLLIVCLMVPFAASGQELDVTVSWNTWETNLDHLGKPGNFTFRGYYSEKVYHEGAPDAPFDDPYDVAADTDIFPFGTMLYVSSAIGWVRVVDVCGACKGRIMVDVWCGKNEYMHRKDNIITTAVLFPRLLPWGIPSRMLTSD